MDTELDSAGTVNAVRLNDAPFFIVGSGRSGTTLLRLVLAGHSRLHVPPETWFLIPLVERLPLSVPLSADQVALAFEIITSHYRWPDMGLDTGELRAALGRLEVPSLRDVVELIYSRLLAGTNKQRIGDKTPVYIGIVPELAFLLPGAKFIHLLRDGRDVAISFIENNWKDRCYDRKAFEWKRAVQTMLNLRDSALCGAMLEVRYEDLVAEPETVVAGICQFLEERYEPGMLDQRGRVSLVPERERSIHRNLNKPINREAAGAWRQRLSALECFIMEACLHRELTATGYQLRFGGAGWRAAFAVVAPFLVAIGPVLKWVVSRLKACRMLSESVWI